MFQNLSFNLHFEGSKNIHVLQVLIWDFGICWRFLTGVCHLDLDLDKVIVLWYIHFLIMSLCQAFEGAKNIYFL